MAMLTWKDFLHLRKNLPLIDVRSQSEYAEGHVDSAINIPLLNDEERVVVGTTYKQQGQLSAIHEGFRLVGPRLHEIISEVEQHVPQKEAIVHCWRGGMRSSNFAQFIGMAKVKSHVLEGGYKTYRQKAFESFAQPFHFWAITGFTGSGKSEILRALKSMGEQVIDLEKLANHKGSAFGAINMPNQPTTEQFQNDLFETILALDVSKPIWIEDESIAIGKIFLPNDLWKRMHASTLVRVNLDKRLRVIRLAREYRTADKATFLQALENITNKLGGQHFKKAYELVLQDDWEGAIDIILTYYDKAYRNSIEKRKDKLMLELTWEGESVREMAAELVMKAKGMIN
ncbi:MAG: tRNA 2-selenouridine(34) synthase MnmH [Cyclobacteriaceae bacterium]